MNKYGCEERSSYKRACDRYASPDSDRSSDGVYLSTYSYVWNFTPVPNTTNLFKIQDNNGYYWQADWDWLTDNYIERDSTDKGDTWRFEIDDDEFYKITANKNCDANGKGEWPCGAPLSWGQMGGIPGMSFFLEVENNAADDPGVRFHVVKRYA